jgi:predicted small lipoprotein YifL
MTTELPPIPRRLLLALAFAAPLAACGRKGDPEPPMGADTRYPRQYPARSPRQQEQRRQEQEQEQQQQPQRSP